MRRDDDYLREIMLKLEASDNWLHQYRLIEKFPGQFTNAREFYHMRCLIDAGMLEVQGAGQLVRMTNSGHDFCAAIRADDRWSDVKAVAAKAGDGSVRFFLKAAEAIAMQKLRDWTGLDL